MRKFWSGKNGDFPRGKMSVSGRKTEFSNRHTYKLSHTNVMEVDGIKALVWELDGYFTRYTLELQERKENRSGRFKTLYRLRVFLPKEELRVSNYVVIKNLEEIKDEWIHYDFVIGPSPVIERPRSIMREIFER